MSDNLLENLDLESTIDPDTLRDNANSTDDHIQAIEILSDHLETDDIEIKVRVLGQIGTYSRRIGHLSEAKIVFTQAIQLAKDNNLDQRYILTNSIRLAHTFHWDEDYESAHQIFEDVITVCKNQNEYNHFLDYAYQHYGKCLFDEGNLKEALTHFNQALELRKIKNDEVLIESTNIAIAATSKKLGLTT